MPKVPRKTAPVKQEDSAIAEQKVKKERKKSRAKPGTNVKKDMKKLQNPQKHPISYAAFRRYIKAIVNDVVEHMRLNGITDVPEDIKLSKNMIKSLRDRVEESGVDDFRRSLALTLHAKRVTTYAKDYLLATRMKDSRTFALPGSELPPPGP